MRNNIDFIEKFFNDARENQRFSDSTLDMYSRDINEFKEFLGEKDILEVNNEIILNYIESLKISYSDRSIYRKVSTLKTFYKYLLQNRIIESLPIQDIQLPKLQKFVPKELELYELNMILEKCGDSFEGIRDSLIIKLIYETGLQINDILNLTRDSLKRYEFKSIVVNRGKNIFSETIPQELGDRLKEFLEIVEKVFPEDEKVFPELSRQSFRARFIAYGKKAGIDHEVSPNMIKKANSQYRESEESRETLLEKIKKVYLEIGIGDD